MLASFILTFRESLEAALVISIIAAYLSRTEKKEAKIYLYLGSAAAILVSVFIGIIVFLFFGELEGRTEKIFEGFTSLTAAIILTYMIFWMARNARSMKTNLLQEMEKSISGSMWGIAGVAFFAVSREGVETVLFLSTIFVSDPAGAISGAILGIILVVLLSFLLFKGILRMDVRKFFTYTGFLLILFSAGLVAHGTHEFVEAGILPAGKEHLWNLNPPLSDGAYPLLHEKGFIGSILASLFGYNANPDLTEVILYLLYWIVVGTIFLRWQRNERTKD